jgi:hypothetical protein
VKSLPSKPLIFAFFLIGIILGMVLIDMGMIQLPEFTAPRPGIKTHETEKAPQHQQSEMKAATRKPPTAKPHDKPVDIISSSIPQAVTEPVRCDRTNALAVRKKAQEMSVISEQGTILNVTLGKDWAYYTPGIRRSFIERFTASDTCLHGSPRTIHFYYRGKEVAVTDTHGAIVMK